MVIQLIHSFNSFTHSPHSYIPLSGDFKHSGGTGEKELTYCDGDFSILNKLFVWATGSFFFAAWDLRFIVKLLPWIISTTSNAVLIPGLFLMNGFSSLLISFFTDLFLWYPRDLFPSLRIGYSSAFFLFMDGVLKASYCRLVFVGASWGRCFLTVD